MVFFKGYKRKNKKKCVQIVISVVVVVFLILLCLITAFVILFPGLTNAKGSVVAVTPACGKSGIYIMKKGGNAVDGAIATLLCESVSLDKFTEEEGGFSMTLYNKSMKNVFVLNVFKVFSVNTTSTSFLKSFGLPGIGLLAKIRGYWKAYQRFGGGVSWAALFEPAIFLCREGLKLSLYAANKQFNMSSSSLRETFSNINPNDSYVEEIRFRRLRLAKLFEAIATEGIDALFDDTPIKGFDLLDENLTLSVQDLSGYQYEWQEPVQINLTDQMRLFTAPPPASGLTLAFVLNLLDNYVNTTDAMSISDKQKTNITEDGVHNTTELFHKISSKEYANEVRKLILNTSTYSNISYYESDMVTPENSGMVHINVLAPNGDAVAVTTISNIIDDLKEPDSSSSGINDNNIMMSLDTTENNRILQKHSLWSACPTIILDKNNNLVLVIGGVGNSEVITNTAQVIMNHIWYKMDINEAFSSKRVQQQLLPMDIVLETNFTNVDPTIPAVLSKIGQNFSYSDEFAAISAISKSNIGRITGVIDYRRPGCVTYVY